MLSVPRVCILICAPLEVLLIPVSVCDMTYNCASENPDPPAPPRNLSRNGLSYDLDCQT
jgi:hypothetical protein